MKKFSLFSILFVSMISVSACQKYDKPQEDKSAIEAGNFENNMNALPKEIKAADSEKTHEELNLYHTFEFNFGDSEGKLELYTSAEIDELGKPLLDDGQNFLILASINEKVFPIFENQYVQLGSPEVSVYHDVDKDELHIILIDARTASYVVSDFVWDEEKQVFIQHDVLNYMGGNHLGDLQIQNN